MNCPLLTEQTAEKAGDILLDYSAGRLDPHRTARLEQHMLVCDRCATFHTGQADLWAALDAWEPQPVSMSFNRRLWQKIDEASAAPWYRKLGDALRLGAWKPVFPLAAAMVVIAAGFMFDHQNLDRTVPGASGVSEVSGVSMTEVDQVEKTLDDIELLRQFNAAASPRPM